MWINGKQKSIEFTIFQKSKLKSSGDMVRDVPSFFVVVMRSGETLLCFLNHNGQKKREKFYGNQKMAFLKQTGMH